MKGNKEDINFVYNANIGMGTFNGEITNNSENDPSIILGNIEIDSFIFNNELLPIFYPEKEHQKVLNEAKNINDDMLYFLSEGQNATTEIKFETKIIKQKRGRVRKSLRKEMSKAHDRNTIDNLLRKVQVHYLSFITTFLNNVLIALNKSKKFQKLDYKYKRNIKKTFVNSLKIKNIGEIISSEISDKYKKFDKNYNKALLEEYKKDEILSELFKKQYLELFRKIYYKNKKKINMKELGINLDQEINLSNAKTFEDLLKEKDNNNNDEEYKSNLKKCIVQHFFAKTHFEIK
jgi:hypothetical protein